MRETEFRGKTGTTEGSKWVYGYYYKVKSFFDNESANYITVIRSNHLTDFSVDEETVGQYTGLKDKKGKKIFGGDIVDVTRPCVWEKGIVILKNGCFFIKVKETLLPLYECEMNNYKLEVIGNIYDNPDLLE